MPPLHTHNRPINIKNAADIDCFIVEAAPLLEITVEFCFGMPVIASLGAGLVPTTTLVLIPSCTVTNTVPGSGSPEAAGLGIVTVSLPLALAGAPSSFENAKFWL